MPTLKNIYYAHIYSHLTYGLTVWGSMLDSKDLDAIFKVQKQCIRIICHAPSRASTDCLFKKLGILRFKDIIKLELVKLGYKLTNSLLPQPVQDQFNKYRGKKCHRYPTRLKNTPNIQKHLSKIFNKSNLCQSLAEYMKIPGTTRNIKSIKQFVSHVKQQYISLY